MKAIGQKLPVTVLSGFLMHHARRPFHLRRLREAVHADWSSTGVVRSKGFFWLASRMDEAGLWS